MFTNTLVFFCLLILFCDKVQAQSSDCSCCTQEYQQFDFWVGNWNVYDQSEKKVGENNILKLQNGCVIQENWFGVGVHTGTSYNFFNKRDSTWNQTWVDNSGLVLNLKGKFADGKMTLESEVILNKETDLYFRHRITWQKMPDESVSQIWITLDENGNFVKELFHGTYRRK